MIVEAKYITLSKEYIDKEHICFAFSDKKCTEGYEMKKAWIPVDAPDYLMVNCL